MKSDAERKRDERQRMRAKGLVLVQVWVHPENRERLRKYVARLNKQRGTSHD